MHHGPGALRLLGEFATPMQIYDPSIHHNFASRVAPLSETDIRLIEPTHSARLVVFPRRTSVYFKVDIFEGSFDRSVTCEFTAIPKLLRAPLVGICRELRERNAFSVNPPSIATG